MTLRLPRPCRYPDLSAASRRGDLPELALVADAGPDNLATLVAAWRSVVPDTRLILLHTPDLGPAMGALGETGIGITACELHSRNALPADARALACVVWASCAPYDAYGVLVKPAVEVAVRGVLAKSAGVFLAHDPAFGVVRWFDAGGLSDRLRLRPVRLRRYGQFCAIVLTLAWLCSRISTCEFKWRKVRWWISLLFSQVPIMSPGDDLALGVLGLAAAFAEKPATATPAGAGDRISTPFSTTSQSDWVEAIRLWNENGRDLITDLPGRPCPACGDARHRQLFRSYDGYPHVECVACGCWYVPLAVDAEMFERFFARCPAAVEVMDRTFRDRLSEASRQSNLDRIGAYLDTLKPMLTGAGALRYLDMGCGLGQSLVAARDRGLPAVGVESSRQCIELARAEGLEVFHVSEDGWHDSAFQLISMWESLEHMVDPLAVLQQCAKRLAPQGLLAFTIPNQNSPLVRTQREDCSFVHGGYDTPGHINLFNPATIEGLLDRAGFQLLALDGQYGLNLAELVSYLIGKQRASFDMLRGQAVTSHLSEESQAVMRSLGPAFALFERVTLIAPILFGIACRKQDAAHLAGAVATYNNRRREQLLAQIRDSQPAPDRLAEQERWRQAQERIQELEEQLMLARNPLERFKRFIHGKPNRTKG